MPFYRKGLILKISTAVRYPDQGFCYCNELDFSSLSTAMEADPFMFWSVVLDLSNSTCF